MFKSTLKNQFKSTIKNNFNKFNNFLIKKINIHPKNEYDCWFYSYIAFS